MNVANLITILRFPLLVAIVLLLYFGGAVGQLMGAPLTVALILMDSLDGVVARRRNEQTLIGGALDIAADRAVEIVLWVVFAHLRFISVAIPLTVVIRGALTDSIRNVALQHGQSAHSMMRSSWGRWLVKSSAMRTIYAVAKAVAFTLLALSLGLQTGRRAAWYSVWIVSSGVSWVAVAICVVRGLPVLIEVQGLFRSAEFQVAAPSVSDE
jgi:CDP-diacylglycerol--glycerol-3-phosphate 3-phosphatidyltransferase